MTTILNAKAPEWYKVEEITDRIRQGSFFHPGMTLEQSITQHLQKALERGFEMGRRVDPTSENVRLREALKARVMVWEDPSTRDFHLCDLCGAHEGDKHKLECVLA